MDSLKRISKVSSALSDPGRLKVVLALKGRSLCVCQIVEMLGLSFPTVSRHLSILESAGLIVAERRGKWTHCRLPGRDGDAVALSAIRWASSVAASLGAEPPEIPDPADCSVSAMRTKRGGVK